MNFKNLFIDYCKTKGFEINQNQIKTIETLNDFYHDNFNHNLLLNFFKKKKNKLGFYLQGDVGVGKTMILNFFYDNLKLTRQRLHFNEFMINFHDFIFQNKSNKKEDSIDIFVKKLKQKYKLIYFDEFQVTNIVDAMILGKLFKKIFEKDIKVIFSSNIVINDLYKDGLQRDQFTPFLKILEDNCYEKNLLIEDDYRTSRNINLERFLSPINQSTNFIFNKFFRKITKGKVKKIKMVEVKGRKIILENFYNGVAKFHFDELCNKNLGSEDYIKIADNCNFVFIDNLPIFNDDNSNQQQRFITLIDIFYEKKVLLTIRSENDLNLLESSKGLMDPFKRTISRLHELTSADYNYL